MNYGSRDEKDDAPHVGFVKSPKQRDGIAR